MSSSLEYEQFLRGGQPICPPWKLALQVARTHRRTTFESRTGVKAFSSNCPGITASEELIQIPSASFGDRLVDLEINLLVINRTFH